MTDDSLRSDAQRVLQGQRLECKKEQLQIQIAPQMQIWLSSLTVKSGARHLFLLAILCL